MALSNAERQARYRERKAAQAAAQSQDEIQANGDAQDIDKQRGRPPAISIEIGRTGLKQYSGYVYEEFLAGLRTSQQRIKTYTEMANNDAIISGFLFAINSVLTAVDWHVEPERAGNADDIEAAEFVSSCLRDMSNTWPSDTLSEILSLLTYGFSYFEVVYKKREGRQGDPLKSSRYDDGRWGWQKFAPRSQESLQRWDFDQNGRLRGMIQLAPPDYEERAIPLNRALLFRIGVHKDNPEGRSLLRGCYRAFFLKKRLQELEAIGVERDLAGLPVFYVDPRLFFDDEYKPMLEAWKNVVRNLRRDEQEGVVIPNVYNEQGHRLYELTLLSTGSRRQSASNDVIERYNAEIAMSALSDFMLLGHTRTGAFALSKTKTDLFSTTFGYVLDAVGNELNERELPRLLALNGMPGECRLIHGKPGHVDIEAFSGMLLNLSRAGLPVASPDGTRERFVLQSLGLPSGDVTGTGVHVPTAGDPGVGVDEPAGDVEGETGAEAPVS